jgi:uncharacterized protein (TIGR02271 family)
MADVKDQNLVSLDDGGWEVAEGEPDVRGWDVVTADQRKIGEVEDLLADPSAQKVRYIVVELDGASAFGTGAERTLRVPIDRARLHERDNQVVIDVATTDLKNFATAPAQPLHTDQMKLTRSAEELKIGKRRVQTGEVEVKKRVETEHVRENVKLRSEDVDVQRRPVSDTSSPGADIRAQEVRVPIYEEEAVVEKRPVVKEEVIISKHPTEKTETVEADIQKERIDVDEHADVRSSERTRTRGIGEKNNG